MAWEGVYCRSTSHPVWLILWPLASGLTQVLAPHRKVWPMCVQGFPTWLLCVARRSPPWGMGGPRWNPHEACSAAGLPLGNANPASGAVLYAGGRRGPEALHGTFLRKPLESSLQHVSAVPGSARLRRGALVLWPEHSVRGPTVRVGPSREGGYKGGS